MKKLFYLLLISLIAVSCSTQKTTKVRTQAEFDAAITAINNGNAMQIKLKKGSYVLTKSILAKSPLAIKGHATITSDRDVYEVGAAVRNENGYNIYKLKHSIGSFPLFIDADGKILHVCESVDSVTQVNKTTDSIIGEYQAKEGIEVKIPITKTIRHLANKTFPMGFGYFDCAWSRVNFRVTKSDDRYFYCKTLDYTNVKDFNYDLTHYKMPIRYVLYNLEKDDRGVYYDEEYLYVPQNVEKVFYITDYTSCNKLPNMELRSEAIIKGVTFDGVGQVYVVNPDTAICEISNSHFTRTLGNALKINKKNSPTAKTAIVQNCTFTDCAILFDNQVVLNSTLNGNNCIRMADCNVSRYPDADLVYKNCVGSIRADGDITIAGNTVYNTCRDHLDLKRGKILCSNNVLYNTDSFNSKTDRNLSSDFGMIYCGNIFYKTPERVLTNSQSVLTLDVNFIHGAYAYGGDARGIFIDDGRCDVTCVHNVIYNTQMYSIDARYAVKFKGVSSVRVKLENNLLGCPYRLQTNGTSLGYNTPFTSGNVLLYNEKNKVQNVTTQSGDIRIPDVSLTNTKDQKKVKVFGCNHTKLKNTSCWQSIKQFVVVCL